jgi:hypothetical protein
MNYRSAESARLVGIGLVSIVAIAVAASTIQSVTTAGGASVTGPGITLPGVSGPGITLPSAEGPGVVPEVGGPDVNIVAPLQQCIQPLAAWYGGLVYFGAFGGVLYLFKRAYSTGAAVLGAYAVAPVAFLGYFLMTSCASAGGVVGPGNPGPTGPSTPPNPFLGLETPLLAAAGVFALALLGVGAVLYRSSGDQTVGTLGDEDEGDRDPADIADLAAAAGKAADRIEQYNADVDNAVYRAWWEMTSLLQVPKPDSATPGEFADAAVDLGMDECDVERLTELFEEVRYGRRDAASREERAVETLRSIETAYGDDDAGVESDEN